MRFSRVALLRLSVIGTIATAGSPLLVHAQTAHAPEGPPQNEATQQGEAAQQSNNDTLPRLPNDPPDAPRRPKYGYWSDGAARWFVSSKSELGAPYAKPYVSAGYGIPHWIWTGVDVNAIVTPDCLQTYGGVRLALPIIDFAFGARDTWSFGKPFLNPAESFNRSMVVDAPGSKARYWAWEAEVVGTVPLPHSALVADFIAIRTLDVPKGLYVYDESYRAITAKPLFFTLRLAAVARFLREDSFKVGVITEYVFGTGRDGDMVIRVGPAASLTLTDHLEVNAVLSLKVDGPDHMGIALGAYGVAGVRYRWATGEKRPTLPWKDPIVPLPF
jgi:hypothetical protein